MKFIGVPVRVRESNNPFFTPKGTLPVMRDGRTVLTNFEQVVDYLKSLVSNNYLLISPLYLVYNFFVLHVLEAF